MNIAITSIGTGIPAHRQSQHKIADFMASKLKLNATEERRLRAVYQATGIEYRHSVLDDLISLPEQSNFYNNSINEGFPGTLQRMQVYNKHALPLAVTAIQDVFSQEDINPQQISHLITVSCTGMSAPGLDIQIIKHFELATTIHRTAINFMGCYGAFSGLKTAHAICKADPDAIVLLVSVELCTLHFQKSNSIEHLISSSLFADGAAAAIIRTNPKIAKSFSLNHFYCDLIPQSAQEMTWSIGEQGFDIALSSYVPQLIGSGIADFSKRLFAKAAIQREDIRHFAIHPGSKKILEACEQALNISQEHNRHSYEILRQYGNMSSATILFILQALLNNICCNDNKTNVFSCAFGPGLTIESMLLQVNHV